MVKLQATPLLKKKETTLVNSAVVLSGQEMPTADVALFSRVIFLQFHKTEYSSQEKARYDQLKAVEKQGLSQITAEINKKNVAFYFPPDQVQHLDVPNSFSQILKNSQGVIVSFDSEANSTTRLQAIDIFRFEIVNAISDAYGGKQIGFASNKESNSSLLPVATCQNSTYFIPVMTVSYSNETRVKLINNCIVVSAVDEYGLISLADNLKYRIYGVIE